MSFSLQQLLSEVPPSTLELQSAKETNILLDLHKPTKVQQEVQKITDNVLNKVKSESSKPIEHQPSKPVTAVHQLSKLATTEHQPSKSHKIVSGVVPDTEAHASRPTTPLQNQHKVLPSVIPDTRAAQSPYPSKNQQKKKNQKNHRQAKKNNARKATKEHIDQPREIKDLDFDALLDYHEKAKTPKQLPVKNKMVAKPEQKKEPPKHNIYDAASESRPVKRPNDSIQRDQQAKKKKPNVQKPNDNNNKRQPNQNQKAWTPMRSCVYFTKGFCKDGDNCTFKHDVPPPVQVVKVCQFYKTGSCVRGSECVFSHDLKLEPCRFYHMDGKCENEEHCPYSHEPLNGDLRERLRDLTGPCRFYQFKGYCLNGDNCMFSHKDCTEDERKKLESSILACRFYHTTGQCRSGDDCFYLHDEASPEQIQKIKQEQNKITSSVN